MKYLKIKIKRGDVRKGEDQMLYPDCYDAMEVEQVKIGPILYPNEIGKGAAEEDCVICFSDDQIADEYITESRGAIIELTETQVDKYLANRWERRNEGEEQVIDANKIMAVQTKKAMNLTLSTEDHDAMDPDMHTPGINRVNKDHNIFFHRFRADNTP